MNHTSSISRWQHEWQEEEKINQLLIRIWQTWKNVFNMQRFFFTISIINKDHNFPLEKKRKGKNEWSQVLIILINRWFLLPFSEHVTCIFMILHFHYGISSHYYRINRPLCLILLNSLLLFVAVVVTDEWRRLLLQWRKSDSPMINHTNFSREKNNTIKLMTEYD